MAERLCVQSSFQGSLDLLSRSVSKSLGLPMLWFDQLYDPFDFLGSRSEGILLVIDECQYLKELLSGVEVDFCDETPCCRFRLIQA